MTYTTLKLTVPAIIALAAAGCTAEMGQSMADGPGKNFAQMMDEYPDISAVEFALLDDDDNGLISAQEEMGIGDGENEIELSDS